MSNDRLIVIAGVSRGGTNLLWNIVVSHPAAIDTYYEINEIFSKKCNISFLEKTCIEFNALTRSKLITHNIISSRIKTFAKYSFDTDQFNIQKSPNVFYKQDDFGNLIITKKLVSAWELNFARKIL